MKILIQILLTITILAISTSTSFGAWYTNNQLEEMLNPGNVNTLSAWTIQNLNSRQKTIWGKKRQSTPYPLTTIYNQVLHNTLNRNGEKIDYTPTTESFQDEFDRLPNTVAQWDLLLLWIDGLLKSGKTEAFNHLMPIIETLTNNDDFFQNFINGFNALIQEAQTTNHPTITETSLNQSNTTFQCATYLKYLAKIIKINANSENETAFFTQAHKDQIVELLTKGITALINAWFATDSNNENFDALKTAILDSVQNHRIIENENFITLLETLFEAFKSTKNQQEALRHLLRLLLQDGSPLKSFTASNETDQIITELFNYLMTFSSEALIKIIINDNNLYQSAYLIDENNFKDLPEATIKNFLDLINQINIKSQIKLLNHFNLIYHLKNYTAQANTDSFSVALYNRLKNYFHIYQYLQKLINELHQNQKAELETIRTNLLNALQRFLNKLVQNQTIANSEDMQTTLNNMINTLENNNNIEEEITNDEQPDFNELNTMTHPSEQLTAPEIPALANAAPKGWFRCSPFSCNIL